MNNILVSFVIPHKGREKFLQQTLESITAQEFDLSFIEVVIVTQNDRLSDETLQFKQKIKLSIYTKPVTDSISSLRNYGAEKSIGEYIAFLDADVLISPNWTNCMLDELHKPNSNRVLVSAIQKNSEHANSIEKIRTALNNISKDSNMDGLAGSNLFLKSDTFELAGGFPSKLTTCEDIYFTNKVRHQGLLYLTSNATFIHLGEDKDYSGMFKKEIWRGLSNLQSLKGRKIPLRELPSIFIPLVLMLLFISSILLLIQRLYMPSIVTVAIMLIPVFAYSIRLRKNSTGQKIKYIDLLAFYVVYFSARSIGIYKWLYNNILKT
jgi:glycosyltransferase involved in cell wall biosynthesis